MCSNQTQVSTDSLLKLQVSKQIEGKTLFTNLLLGNYVLRNAKLLSIQKMYIKKNCANVYLYLEWL